MRPRRSLLLNSNVDELIERLGRLTPQNERQWGTLTPHEMLCHLSDSFLAVLGDRPASQADTWFGRSVVKWVALHTSMPWPQGVPTRPEVNPKIGGTQPTEFEHDRREVIQLLRRFVEPRTQFHTHPGFGRMTRHEWLLWGYGHLDHHLRQFGL
jgi:Protein of unknown function (DUF1569)